MFESIELEIVDDRWQPKPPSRVLLLTGELRTERMRFGFDREWTMTRLVGQAVGSTKGCGDLAVVEFAATVSGSGLQGDTGGVIRSARPRTPLVDPMLALQAPQDPFISTAPTNLSGLYESKSGQHCYVTQAGSTVAWVCEQEAAPGVPPLCRMFVGRRSGDVVTGSLVDLPKSSRMLRGPAPRTYHVRDNSEITMTSASASDPSSFARIHAFNYEVELSTLLVVASEEATDEPYIWLTFFKIDGSTVDLRLPEPERPVAIEHLSLQFLPRDGGEVAQGVPRAISGTFRGVLRTIAVDQGDHSTAGALRSRLGMGLTMCGLTAIALDNDNSAATSRRAARQNYLAQIDRLLNDFAPVGADIFGPRARRLADGLSVESELEEVADLAGRSVKKVLRDHDFFFADSDDYVGSDATVFPFAPVDREFTMRMPSSGTVHDGSYALHGHVRISPRAC